MRYAVYEGEAAVRGTVLSLGHRGKKSFTFGCSIDRNDWQNFDIELSVGQDNELHVSEEKITGISSTAPLYEVVSEFQGSNDIKVAYNNFARGGKKPQIICTDQMAVLTQLRTPARFAASHKAAQREIPAVTEAFVDQLTNIIFLDPQPSLMRSYSFKAEETLSGDGSNLSGVLWRLCQSAQSKKQILSLIRSLPEQNIADISFVETPRGEAMVQLSETFGGVEHNTDATLLSDGTLRVLSIAAALMSAPQKGLVVIEEIDNGIHPSRAEAILESIAQIAESRSLSVLISSHNPALLDSLPKSAIEGTVFCYRDQQDGSSKLVRLGDLPRYPELVAQGEVGHLLTTGLLDRFVKSSDGGGSRIEKRKRWLAELRNTAYE